MLLVQHLALLSAWSTWSTWSSLIHLGLKFPECGYTKWTKQDQGGPGVVQGYSQDHGGGCWTRSIQDHRGPLKELFLDVSFIKLSVKWDPCMLGSNRATLAKDKRGSFMLMCKLPWPQKRGVSVCSSVSLLLLWNEFVSYSQRGLQFHPHIGVKMQGRNSTFRT